MCMVLFASRIISLKIKRESIHSSEFVISYFPEEIQILFMYLSKILHLMYTDTVSILNNSIKNLRYF